MKAGAKGIPDLKISRASRCPSATGRSRSREQASGYRFVLLRAYGVNISDDRIALSWFQIRAMRHAVYDIRPILDPVMPERWQRVTFDATVNEKCAAFAQDRKISMLAPASPSCGGLTSFGSR